MNGLCMEEVHTYSSYCCNCKKYGWNMRRRETHILKLIVGLIKVTFWVFEHQDAHFKVN